MKHLVQALIALWAGAALLASACAADAVRINFDAEYPPFMSARDGQPSGVYPALIAAALALIQQPFSFEAKPWKRALLELDEGRAGVGGIYKNEARTAKYDFSDPILTEHVAVYFNKARPIAFKTLADLYGKRVGVLRGWSYGDAFDAARRNGSVTVEEVTNDKANFLKLEHGRLDAVLAVEEAGRSVIVAENLASVEQSKALLASNTAHLAFNRSAGQTDLLARFNKAIAEMKRDGTLDTIVHAELAR